MAIKVGELYKHFKGKSLLEKNIYEIIAVNVTYTGENVENKLNNLVVYRNIFQEDKFFIREEDDLIEELSKEKQEKYGQVHRIEKLTKEEIEVVTSENFRKQKENYIKSNK